MFWRNFFKNQLAKNQRLRRETFRCDQHRKYAQDFLNRNVACRIKQSNRSCESMSREKSVKKEHEHRLKVFFLQYGFMVYGREAACPFWDGFWPRSGQDVQFWHDFGREAAKVSVFDITLAAKRLRCPFFDVTLAAKRPRCPFWTWILKGSRKGVRFWHYFGR